jgi:hypothetical protein
VVWNFDRKEDARIVGALPIYPAMRNRNMVQGRFFSDLEL